MRPCNTAALAVALATVLLAIPRATPLAAQQCDCAAPPAARWSAFLSIGGALVETTSINKHVDAAGYFALSRDAVATGIGGSYAFGELRIGAEYLRHDAGEESNPSGLSARLRESSTILTLGWELRPGKRLSVTPAFGVGRGTFALTVGDRAGGAPPPASPAPTFDEILASPGRSSRIAAAHWVLEPSIATELLVVRRPGARQGVTLGARAGYRLAPNRPEWKFRGDLASGGPVDQAKGPIVRVTLGYGGL